MTKKIYRSARGKAVDIGALMLQNEHTRAVGNMKVNARGDRINANNEIIEPRTQVVEKTYDLQTNVSDEVIPTSARHVKEMEREKYMAEKMRNTEKAHRKAVKAQIKDGENPEPQKLAQPTEAPACAAWPRQAPEPVRKRPAKLSLSSALSSSSFDSIASAAIS